MYLPERKERTFPLFKRNYEFESIAETGEHKLTTQPIMLSPMREVKAVIFDLDGTLVRSRLDYREMTRRVREILMSEGVHESVLNRQRRIWETIRGGVDSLKALGLSSERVLDAIGRINEALNTIELQSLDTVEPMRGAHEALMLIKDRGLRIGVATRACREYAERSLKTTGLADYVDILLARDEVEHPKPDPRHILQIVDALDASLENTIYIGDTMTDLETAMAANIAFIGFISNDEWAGRLREAGCEIFISDLKEIINIIDCYPD